MKTVTLDILNDEAIKLLKNLEGLKLIRFHKGKTSSQQTKEQVSLSDFSFSKSREILKDYQGSLSDTVADDRRSEI